MIQKHLRHGSGISSGYPTELYAFDITKHRRFVCTEVRLAKGDGARMLAGLFGAGQRRAARAVNIMPDWRAHNAVGMGRPQ